MAVERTLSIIKPDAVKKNAIGQILARFEKAGLRVVAARMMHLSRAEAEGFYAVHRERPFFGDLVKFMTSGPCVVMAIEGENAVARYREVMGPGDYRLSLLLMDRTNQRPADARRAGPYKPTSQIPLMTFRVEEP